MNLSARVGIPFDREPFVALIEGPDGPWRAPPEHRAVLAWDGGQETGSRSLQVQADSFSRTHAIVLPAELAYLSLGDIVRVNPHANELRVLYRRASRFNSLLLTERCNSRCVMCSQPPRDVNDDFLVDDLLNAIPLMSPDTVELGLSGGEPTLLGERFLELLACAKRHLPRTALHVLSNGRMLRFLRYTQAIASIGHPDLMLGVPLYGDTASLHDYVVQARGAFGETLVGLLNLGRLGVRTEIRVVIHADTCQRLPQLARFIASNLPFVDQVVLMGLEPMGFGRTNFAALWIDPVDYARELDAAVAALDGAGIRVWIYNHPLCVLPRSLWPFARQSISDWKNTFLPGCDVCAVRGDCAGFFSSAKKVSRGVAPVESATHSECGRCTN